MRTAKPIGVPERSAAPPATDDTVDRPSAAPRAEAVASEIALTLALHLALALAVVWTLAAFGIG